MPNVSRVAQMHLPTFGDYGPVSEHVKKEGLDIDIYPLRNGKYLVEGKKNDLYGGWNLCVNMLHHRTPSSALNSMLKLYGGLLTGYDCFGHEYEVWVSLNLRKEKRDLSCTIRSDDSHRGWYETHGRLGDNTYASPGDVLDAYLDSVFSEPYAEYVYARGSLGEM